MTSETLHRNSTIEDFVDDLGTEPIPAKYYYDPEIFELEKNAIFRRHWLHVGHVCELPEKGSYIVRDIDAANASILITRGPDDVIRAFHNVCTHRGAQLVLDKQGQRTSFGCFYHQWNFSYDGSLRAAPDFDSFYVDKSKCNLKAVAVDVVAGLIYINLEKNPKQSLREYLADAAEFLEKLPVARATTFSEYTYEMDGNWKLIFDNFQENYHLRFVHSRSGAAGVYEENPFGYPAGFRSYGPHGVQVMASNPNPKVNHIQGLAFAKQIESAIADGLELGPHNREYHAMFPNFFMFGSPMQPFSLHIEPLAHNKSRGTFRLYWIGDDDSASRRVGREYAMAAARDLHSEDRVAIEASQKGLSTGALEYIHFQKHEVLCRHFFNAVKSAIDDYQQSLAAKGGN